MNKIVVPLLLLCACFTAQASNSTSDSAGQAPNPVVQWNQTLLVIVRTPGAQSATIHPTRSFAMMHAAIYDAVNSIDRTHSPYLVQIAHILRRASEDAAADTAAHDVLVALYPAFQATLDTQLQQFPAATNVGHSGHHAAIQQR
jgi:hypothetical protein